MITSDHVRELLADPDEDLVLVVVEGRAHVVPRPELGTGRYGGGLEVASAADLADLVPVPEGAREGGDEELRQVAAALEAEVNRLGG
ncbi:hypothetical protein GCM10010406_22720 [Streptomyces thermolineatus]|uniref:Uncharacterized protein n=1 Tax=Streptomyces thermolineatus TaxID=44033 RepID=A0ABP5YS77_9ACTN|nr:hypothetical protein [Streptomyces sp. HB2AG]MCZ2525036.1 hypothetical protein [Streptomyces sp. HB2AG]